MDIASLIAQISGDAAVDNRHMKAEEKFDRTTDPIGDGPRVPKRPPGIGMGGSARDDAVNQMIEQMTGVARQGPMERSAANEMINQLTSLIGGPGGGFDADTFAAERKAAWDADETGGESGFDAETLDMLVEMLDGEGINQLSGNDISKAFLRGEISPEVDALYSQLSPENKMAVMEELVNSDGLGTLEQIIEMISDDATRGSLEAEMK